MSKEFDFQAALKALQSGQDLGGKDGILTPLIKQLTEAALQRLFSFLCHGAQSSKYSSRRPLVKWSKLDKVAR